MEHQREERCKLTLVFVFDTSSEEKSSLNRAGLVRTGEENLLVQVSKEVDNVAQERAAIFSRARGR